MNISQEHKGLPFNIFTFREDEDVFNNFDLDNSEYRSLYQNCRSSNQVEKAIDLLKLGIQSEKDYKLDYMQTAEHTMKQNFLIVKDSYFGGAESPKRSWNMENFFSTNFNDLSKFLNKEISDEKSLIDPQENTVLNKWDNSQRCSTQKSTGTKALSSSNVERSKFLDQKNFNIQVAYGKSAFQPAIEWEKTELGTIQFIFEKDNSEHSPKSQTIKTESTNQMKEGKSSSSEGESKYVRTKLASIVDNEKDTSLSKRRDVVNKTILRVLRRYFTQVFKGLFPKKYKTKEAKKRWYLEYIKLMWTELFGSQNENISEIQFYMASIIRPDNMKDEDFGEFDIEKIQFDSFHDCLYRYSHTKMVNLLKVHPIGLIYQHFYNGPLDQILRSEASIRKNFSVYSVALEEFYFIFTGEMDVSSLVLN